MIITCPYCKAEGIFVREDGIVEPHIARFKYDHAAEVTVFKTFYNATYKGAEKKRFDIWKSCILSGAKMKEA